MVGFPPTVAGCLPSRWWAACHQSNGVFPLDWVVPRLKTTIIFGKYITSLLAYWLSIIKLADLSLAKKEIRIGFAGYLQSCIWLTISNVSFQMSIWFKGEGGRVCFRLIFWKQDLKGNILCGVRKKMCLQPISPKLMLSPVSQVGGLGLLKAKELPTQTELPGARHVDCRSAWAEEGGGLFPVSNQNKWLRLQGRFCRHSLYILYKVLSKFFW